LWVDQLQILLSITKKSLENPEVQPVINVVIVKVIVESKANVMNNAVNNIEYLAFDFKKNIPDKDE